MSMDRDKNAGKRPNRARIPKVRPAVLAVVAAAVLGFAVVGIFTLASAAPGMAQAAALTSAQSSGQKVVVFEDLTVGPDQTWENVVVVGGDLVVEGAVEDTVVVVGGDLTLRSGARVGYGQSAGTDDTAIVAVFGHVTLESGVEISGRVVDVGGRTSEAFAAAFVDPVARPWRWTSAVGWIASTIFLAVVAVIIVAIAPRKIAVVRDRARSHLLSSLGWGVLGIVVGIPLSVVLLIVTVVGLLVVVPWLFIAIPIILLFGFVAIAALLGQLVLGHGEDQRGRVMAAAVLGVVIFSVLRWIPYAGGVIVMIAVLVGLGAVITAIWEGNRRPRGQVQTPTQPAQPTGAEWSGIQASPGTAAPEWSSPPADRWAGAPSPPPSPPVPDGDEADGIGADDPAKAKGPDENGPTVT